MNEARHNLLIRTATGVVFVAVLLAMTLLGRATYWMIFGFIAWLCIYEFRRLARGRVQQWLGAIYIFLCIALMSVFPALGVGMVGEGGWADCAIFSAFPEGWDARVTPIFMVVVWANDVFAYLVGSTLGKHKMCERVSPHKTWEGFAGGIIGAVVVSALAGHWVADGNAWLWAAFGLFVALASVAGDLTESRFKRAAGVKDSGRLLPGHGGVLDRFDAMLGAAPVAFLFFLVTYLIR